MDFKPILRIIYDYQYPASGMYYIITGIVDGFRDVSQNSMI